MKISTFLILIPAIAILLMGLANSKYFLELFSPPFVALMIIGLGLKFTTEA